MKRIVQPEILDTLPPGDPRAVRSRRDLRRINSWMRHHAILARTLKGNLAGRAPVPITELGAGDGNFLLAVAQRLGSSGVPPSGGLNQLESSLQVEAVRATLLDRHPIVSPATLAAFAGLGWRAEAVVADAFDWSPKTGGVVVANLFLHHFERAQLAELLRKISQRAGLFVALEPRRAPWPLFCSRLLWAIGCNDVTRHDAVVSVRAGFVGRELSAFWPDESHWELSEQPAGAFSHLFIARKIS